MLLLIDNSMHCKTSYVFMYHVAPVDATHATHFSLLVRFKLWYWRSWLEVVGGLMTTLQCI